MVFQIPMTFPMTDMVIVAGRMKYIPIIIIAVSLLTACGNSSNKGKSDVICGGPGIGIDTARVKEILREVDSIAKINEEAAPIKTAPQPYATSSDRHRKYDNMRGFDPASEDDMDDNGMSRYMENTDDEGWD